VQVLKIALNREITSFLSSFLKISSSSTDVVTTLLDRFGTEKNEIAKITDYIAKKEMVTMFDALVEQHWKLKDEGYNQAKAEDQEQIRQLEEENRRLRERRSRI
jgi:cell shape-determining protein MreC